MRKRGFSLVETLIAVGIFAMIVTALYTLFTLGIKIVNEDKARVGARVLAEQKMEIIKNLSYQDIGTVGGVPSGTILPTEIVNLNAITYTITTFVQYFDDPYDGVAPTDTVNTDYKKIRIEVRWNSQFDTKPLVLVSDITPKDIETLIDGGTLWLEVYDSTPGPISGANVNIINNAVVPAVNISGVTNAQGVFSLPGALASTQGYQIIISKAGYSTTQTYNADPITNPNPDPANLSVGNGEITNKTFIIDLLANLQINAKLESGDPVPNFSCTLHGDQTIGTNGDGSPIYQYEQNLTTSEVGTIELSGLNPQLYNLEFDAKAQGYDLAGYSPNLPLQLAPQGNAVLDITLAPHAENSLLVTVKDGAKLAQPDASIKLSNLESLDEQTKSTNSAGQVFFSPLESGLYNLEINKPGFDLINLEVTINGQTEQQIFLSST